MRTLAAALLLGAAVACGPSPDARPPAPSGTLVIVVRQGPERVSFQPKVDRIRRANEQLSAILGHSIQIEIDGSLLPQDHDGAQDVIARLVETVAQDLDTIKEHEPNALPVAAATFERLVVRYSPTESAQRGRRYAVLDRAKKTIDVTLGESRWLALKQNDISDPILRVFDGEQADKYAHVLPDRLSARERRAWLDYHIHQKSKPDPGQALGSVDALTVRGAVTLAKDGDAEARKYLVERTLSDFSTTYHHQQAEVEAAPDGSPFRRAESAFVAWLRDTLPTMTVEEREHVARGLWVFDFRKNRERDPYASFAFPGIDRMAFGFAQADAWSAANHPSRVRVYDDVVGPVRLETARGEFRYQGEGTHNPNFYRWALAAPAREDAFVQGLLARSDPAFVMAAFYNAHTALRDEADYLRFLRRFEASAPHWRAGADVHRAVIYRPSPAVLEEARRQWREVPIARGHALFYFARQADGSYHPEVDWPDMLQGRKPDDAILQDTLALGWQAFELVPTFWRQVQKTSGRLGLVETAALQMLDQDARAMPGHRDVGGILAAVGRIDCEDGDLAEVAALRKWAEAQIPSRPGQRLSQILEATDPKECQPKHRAAPPPRKPAKPKWREGDPLPPKEPW